MLDFIMPAGTTELTSVELAEFITRHQAERLPKYERMEKLYKGDHAILRRQYTEDETYKPNNKLVANFAKYITDTLNGYFLGIPIKVTHPDEAINDEVQDFGIRNAIDDHNAELSKDCSIYGVGYELMYTDELGEACVTTASPKETFVIYDDSIIKRPLFGVRYYLNTDGELEGSYCNAEYIRRFNKEHKITDEQINPFNAVSILEVSENEERLGTFESAETLINAYDKAISEKANDVDYYADAYLKIIGPGMDESTLQSFRRTRLIHAETDDPAGVVIDFLAKPEADTTQENLINRLERLIFQVSMVANINDENFGQASGVALAYKLLPMSNLAQTKERKFTALLQKRYKLLFGLPDRTHGADEWIRLSYRFTRNNPKNLLEESQIAGNLAGITSEETQLSVLSIVDDPKTELEQKNEELKEQDVMQIGFMPENVTE